LYKQQQKKIVSERIGSTIKLDTELCEELLLPGCPSIVEFEKLLLLSGIEKLLLLLGIEIILLLFGVGKLLLFEGAKLELLLNGVLKKVRNYNSYISSESDVVSIFLSHESNYI
jgi:hypothetical protein